MDQGLNKARIVIGHGSDFEIVWVEDLTTLPEIEGLLKTMNAASGSLSKEAILATLDPKVHYCLDRCDNSIQSVAELIENFTFWMQQYSIIRKCMLHCTKKFPFKQIDLLNLVCIYLVCAMHSQRCIVLSVVRLVQLNDTV